MFKLSLIEELELLNSTSAPISYWATTLVDRKIEFHRWSRTPGGRVIPSEFWSEADCWLW